MDQDFFATDYSATGLAARNDLSMRIACLLDLYEIEAWPVGLLKTLLI
jgi:hypothetical protein